MQNSGKNKLRRKLEYYRCVELWATPQNDNMFQMQWKRLLKIKSANVFAMLFFLNYSVALQMNNKMFDIHETRNWDDYNNKTAMDAEKKKTATTTWARSSGCRRWKRKFFFGALILINLSFIFGTTDSACPSAALLCSLLMLGALLKLGCCRVAHLIVIIMSSN